MEDKAKLIKRGTKARAGGGCPTRLQKHAPASLEISGRPANPFAPSNENETSKAIPLLSPLIQTPQTLMHAEDRTSENSGNGSISISSSATPCTGWEHAPFPEPSPNSSLCSFLQNKCVIVNNAQ